jgi:hypothetical protein
MKAPKNRPYYLCFGFRQLYSLERTCQTSGQNSRFKIELFKGTSFQTLDNEFVGKTDLLSASYRANNAFLSHSNLISLIFHEDRHKTASFGEMRLIERGFDYQEKIIGSYRFPISNYLAAYR